MKGDRYVKEGRKGQNFDAGIGKYDTGKKAKTTPVKCSFEISRSKEDRR